MLFIASANKVTVILTNKQPVIKARFVIGTRLKGDRAARR